jgi:hypothetical protein
MSSESENQPANDKTTADEAREGEAMLIAAAREYFATGFPNPEHQGCPPPDDITALVRSGRAPGEALSGHLFSCSECFNLYRAAMARRAAASSAAAPSRPHLFASLWANKRSWLLAAALCLLCLSPVGWFAWRAFFKAEPPAVSEGKNNAGSTTGAQMGGAMPDASPSPAPTASPAPRVDVPATPPGVQEKETVPVRLDLEDYVARRQIGGAGDAAEQAIRLPAARVRLTLRLAEQSAAGSYVVSVVDLSGREVAGARAVSRDGRRLTATLDLGGLSGVKYRLRLSPGGGPPEHYPVRIEE